MKIDTKWRYRVKKTIGWRQRVLSNKRSINRSSAQSMSQVSSQLLHKRRSLSPVFHGRLNTRKKAQKYKKEGKHERYIGRGPSFLLLLLLFLQWHCQYLMPRQLVLFIYNSSCSCSCSCFSCCVRNSSCPEGDDYSSCWLNNRISLLLWVRDQVSFVSFCLSILCLLLEYYL